MSSIVSETSGVGLSGDRMAGWSSLPLGFSAYSRRACAEPSRQRVRPYGCSRAAMSLVTQVLISSTALPTTHSAISHSLMMTRRGGTRRPMGRGLRWLPAAMRRPVHKHVRCRLLL